MNPRKEYFIFISYSNLDIEWAEWLQEELEHYKLPATFNGSKNVRDNLRDVFRDRDELSAGSNWDEQVEPALANTSNLVVICSPNSAQSEAVNREIEIFIKQGKGNRIFPFIVSGDSPKECFPPALNHKIIGGDVNKDGSCNKAFAKVVSGILGVEFDSIWQRYEQDKAKKEKELREQRNSLYRVQSRFLAEKAEKWIYEGNSLRAALLMLEALPKRVDDLEDKPLVNEAQRMLRKALSLKTIEVKGDINHEDFDGYIKNRTLIYNGEGGISFLNIDTGDSHALDPKERIGGLSVKFSPSGALFAYITGYTITICDSKTRSVLYRHERERRIYFGDKGEKIVFSPDEKSLLIVHLGDNYIYDFEKNEIYPQYSVHDHIRKYYRENISKFSEVLAGDEYYVRISGNKLKVYERVTGKCVAFTTDWFASNGIAMYNPYNKSIVYQRHDGTLKCLKIDDGSIYSYSHQVTGAIGAITFLSETNEMALLCNHNILNIVRYDNTSEEGLKPFVKKCRFSPDSRYVAAIIYDNSGIYSIGIWHPGQQNEQFITPDYSIAQSKIKICNIAINADSQTIAVHYVDNTIKFYSVQNGVCLGECEPHKDLINDMAYSPCGNYFATASDDCTIKIWSRDCSVLASTIKTREPVLDFQYDKNGKYILATNSTNVKLYSVDTRKCVKTFKVETKIVPAQFSPCNKYIVACSANKVYVYELSSGKCINKIEADNENIEAFGFIRANGDYFINYGSHNTYVGNIETTELERLWGYYGVPYSKVSIERSNDGEYLLNGNEIFKRRKENVKTYGLNEEFSHESRILEFISMGYLTYNESAENNDLSISEHIDLIHDRYRLSFNEKSISVIDTVTEETIEEFYCDASKESILDATFTQDGNHIIYTTDHLYSGYLKYRKEFKPIQILIDETASRYSQSELTKQEREQCYLD